MNPKVERWIRQSEQELWAAQQGLRKRPRPAFETSCELARFAAERAPKALLQAQNAPIPKSHILHQLSDRLSGSIPALALMREDLAWLTNLGLQMRYPDRDGDLEATKKAIDIAERVIELAKPELGV